MSNQSGGITWTSNDTSVATVTDLGSGDATVIAVGVGTATIRATVTSISSDPVYAECIVTVTAGDDPDPDPDPDPSPKTGDANRPILYTALLLAGAVVLAVLAKRRRHA